eukprot:89803-Ditylum_brightwellii.AAC.1
MSTNINEDTMLADPTNVIVHTSNKNLELLYGRIDQISKMNLNFFRKWGLNKDDDIEFSSQLMSKFRKWKNSRLLAASKHD